MDVVDENFDEPLTTEITNEFFEAFIQIEGESIDSAHANVPIGLLTACVLCQVLKNRGLLKGKQSKIAEAVDKTGSGLQTRLENLEKEDPYGVFNASRLYDQQECGILHVKRRGRHGWKTHRTPPHQPFSLQNPKRFSSPNPTTKQAARNL